jgi:hypothetical protein
MAKRTPRSEAEDTSTATAPARPARSANDTDEQSKNRTRTRGTRRDESDTFAANPESGDQPMADIPPDAAAEPNDQPSEDEIRRRAYELYLERGGGHGMHFEDWVRAEEELRNRNR